MKKIALKIILFSAALLVVGALSANAGGIQNFIVDLSSQATGTLPVANGGRGRVSMPVDFKTQGYLPSTITISNFLGTSSTITNNLEFKFNTGTQASPILSSNFSFTCGLPSSSNISGTSIASITPQNAGKNGIYCVEFIVYANNIEIPYVGGSSNRGSFDVSIDEQLVFSSTDNLTTPVGTASAGGSTTITLTGTSSTDGYYNQQYVYINGGTGVGQRKRIIGYVGSTKVATVDSAWSINPDNTSTYVVSPSPYAYTAIQSGVTAYPHFNFSGELLPHKVRIVSSAMLKSVITDSFGVILPIKKEYKTKMVFITDSFGAGYGNGSWQTSYPFLLSRYLGFDIEFLGVGNTGILNDNSALNLNYIERTVPPVNSWKFTIGNSSAGTYKIIQGSTSTSNIAYNANLATIQAAIDAAFGSSKFKVLNSNAAYLDKKAVIAIDNSIKNITTDMTLDTSGLTTGSFLPSISRYTGDLDQVLPKDANGNNAPFVLWIQGSGNDSTKVATLQAETELWISSLKLKYPQAQIILSGMWMNKGPMDDANYLAIQSILNNASTKLNKINDHVPYVNTWNESTGVGYMIGTTTVMAPSGLSNVNSDILAGNTPPHASSVGHFFLADFFASSVAQILAPK